MENLSIKILDALFDLCEGENYVILDKEDIVKSFTDHTFETDELTEILESLTVEGFIDLKYADNTEYCVAMRTKGRTLIKQSREKLQHILNENPVIEGESGPAPIEAVAEDPVVEFPPRPEHRTPRHRQPMPIPPEVEEEISVLDDGHFTDSGKLSRGYTMPDRDGLRRAAKTRERRAFLAAMIGGAVGSVLMGLIFLVVILIKFTGKS